MILRILLPILLLFGLFQYAESKGIDTDIAADIVLSLRNKYPPARTTFSIKFEGTFSNNLEDALRQSGYALADKGINLKYNIEENENTFIFLNIGKDIYSFIYIKNEQNRYLKSGQNIIENIPFYIENDKNRYKKFKTEYKR